MFDRAISLTSQNNNHFTVVSKFKAAKKSTTKQTMTADRDIRSTQEKSHTDFHGCNITERKESTCNKRNVYYSQIWLATFSQAQKPLMTITILITILSLFYNGFITQSVDGASVNTVGKYKSQRDRGKFFNNYLNDNN